MKPVLILGAGINGAAVARDLAINGLPVCIVDTGDVARGATSRSSRLIHGGLRYLEYRDTQLVRESLQERERLLQLAPHFVKPLRLTIPVSRRLGGLWAGFIRFTGLGRTSIGQALLKLSPGPRGLLAIRVGLAMYDRLAGRGSFPGHQVKACASTDSADAIAEGPKLPVQKFKWQCSYSDAQIEFPERFVLAMLEDGRRAAEYMQAQFHVLPYHRAIASESSSMLTIESLHGDGSHSSRGDSRTIEPSIIINATGAWGDRTLEALGLQERQLFAGTKGSHLFSSHPPLIQALNGNGIYAEADDGRLIFILPCASGVLIGTTDDPYSGDPGDAVSTSEDTAYLIEMVNDVFPEVRLTADEVSMHHAGVRPLPHCNRRSAAAIPRGHSIERSQLHDIPILTLVGGKLTTCRSLAEEVCSIVCKDRSQRRDHDTGSRLIPGAEEYPSATDLNEHHQSLADRYGLSMEQVQTIWKLVGNRFDEIFPEQDSNDQAAAPTQNTCGSIVGTTIPQAFVKWSIKNEWCTRLEDLVERRLMLIFEPHLQHSTLHALAIELVKAGRLEESKLETGIDSVSLRLLQYYGIAVTSD